MNKILLIIQREYLARVKKKSFIVMTLLVPALISLMFVIIFLIAKNSSEINKVAQITVIDESGDFTPLLHNKAAEKFTYSKQTLAEGKKLLEKDHDLFVLYIPADYSAKGEVQFLSQKKSNIMVLDDIENQMEKIATGHHLVAAGIDTAKLSKANAYIHIDSKQITDGGTEKDASVGTAYALSTTGAILIYISLILYGAMVMRGVIEEKTSRIIEVIVSSVKPIQLMLGKIIGVGAVGITQFILWIFLSWAGGTVTTMLLTNNKPQPVKTEKVSTMAAITQKAQSPPTSPVANFISKLDKENYQYILGCFLFYFVSGYLLYSAMFAAVGSAVDSETETQQFMFPVTMPLLFTYILSFAFLIYNPDSSLAFWLSMIPFTAPVAMMVRVPFGVPDWQLALSMFLMVVGFIATSYVAARIYRVGILMYGKKASYKELVKWFFYKE